MAAFATSVACFFLLAAAALALHAALSTDRQAARERLAWLALSKQTSHGLLGQSDVAEQSFVRSLLRKAAMRVPMPERDSAEGKKLTRLMLQAGWSTPAMMRTFQLCRLAAAAGGTVAGLILAIVTDAAGFKPVLYIVCGAAAGAFLPTYLVARKARGRQRAIASQLSDALDLLVVCVEAGLGLHEAIKVVGEECHSQGQAIGRELSLVAAEVSAGKPLGQTLRDLAERTGVDDVKPLAATIIQSEQLGAQIAPALRGISNSLRDRRRLRAEAQAQKTTVKILFPLVLFILPAMLMVIVGPAMIQIFGALSHH